jgi:hypothetical protein
MVAVNWMYKDGRDNKWTVQMKERNREKYYDIRNN